MQEWNTNRIQKEDQSENIIINTTQTMAKGGDGLPR